MTDQNTSWNRLFSHRRQELRFGEALIVVENGVFTPDPGMTYSASMIIENLPSLEKLRVADIGTGSGVLAVVATLKGAEEVVATDISDIAVKNALSNASLNGVTKRMKVLKSDLFEGVEGKFDVICANLPILDELWEQKGIHVESTIELFLKKAKLFLNSGGKIYLPWASFGDKPYLESLLKKLAYNFQLLAVEKLGYAWYLYILTYPE